MDYKEFVKKCKTVSTPERQKFIKKHVIKTYLPYATKITEARMIVNNSCYREINGKKIFQQDSPAFFMGFMIRVLKNYTDIECEDKDTLAMFDLIFESELWEPIIAAIPTKEYDTFNTVLQMVKDDEFENYRSIAGYFETKMDSLNLVLNTLIEATEKANK